MRAPVAQPESGLIPRGPELGVSCHLLPPVEVAVPGGAQTLNVPRRGGADHERLGAVRPVHLSAAGGRGDEPDLGSTDISPDGPRTHASTASPFVGAIIRPRAPGCSRM